MRRYHLQPHDQLYFLHIPKTGGMSLMHTLYDYFPQLERRHFLVRDLLTSPDVIRSRPFFAGHTFFLVHHFLDQPPLYSTILRDPVARVTSLFRHIQRQPDHPLHETFHSATLLEFLRSPEAPTMTQDVQTLSLVMDTDPRTYNLPAIPGQLRKITTRIKAEMYERYDEPTLLQMAKERLANFAFVGIMEQFASSVDLLTYTFHWQPLSDLRHFNVDPEQLVDIPQEALDLITERTRLDAQLYQFGLEIMQRRSREMRFDLLNTDYRAALPPLSADHRALAAPTHTLPAASQPYLNDITGWSDGWAGPRWVFSGQSLPVPMKTLEITGKAFPAYYPEPLRLTVLVDRQVSQQLDVVGENFSLAIPLGTAVVELLANQYFIPAQIHASPDHRPLSWLLESINLKA